MRGVRPVLFTLLTVGVVTAQNPDTDPAEGLAILQKMSEHYAAATSWHIEATEERTSENEYSRGWTKTVIVASVSGNKYRYEGHSNAGSALHISDGKTAWDLHPEEHAYKQEPAPANGYQQPREWQMNEQAAVEAVRLRKQFAEFATHYNSATRLPDETVTQIGRGYPCYVVRVMDEQRKDPKTQGLSIDETLWIDKTTWVVRKTATHEKTFFYSGSAHIPIVENTDTAYNTAELNSPVPDDLFRFKPPADAVLVAKFKEGMLGGADLTGEAAPDVQLIAADGKRTPLSSYRGKPVLLDFWATWCGPCVASMPKLAKLYEEATPKGLVVLSVDEDEDEKAATDFLSKHNYTWPNTHDDGKLGDAFKKIGIPLILLLDPQGKIVFYKSGADDSELRKAVAGLGSEFASLAREKPQPCELTSKSN